MSNDARFSIGNRLRPATEATEDVEGICAQVSIRIEQEAVLTRTAFLGTLQIDNGHDDESLTNVRVVLDIRDEQGNPANDLFGVRGPELSGLSDVTGNGVVGPGASGIAKYTLIPTRDAAANGPTVYHIGGTLEYMEEGQLVSIDLFPAAITVHPDALLKLNYFHQRDVIGDDPFTEEVEPSEPFVLGLLASNIGQGVAKNFTITSAQPEIVENEKGLVIDFRIIASQVGSEEVIPSLTANLGNIQPGDTQFAAWFLISTLQGRFVDYKASFEHVDGLGNPRLSLIDTVDIHELIHTVRADRPGDDDLLDFLANDVDDAEVVPDTLYLSDGTVAVVNEATNLQTDGSVSLSDLTVQLTASMTTGWNYLRLLDPGSGFRLSRVVRDDGYELLVGDNVWQTHRTFSEADSSFRRENRLHLLDFDGTGSYTLHYVVDDSVAPQLLDVIDVSPDPQASAVSSVDVVFSELIDLATFTFEDLELTLNGGANLITEAGSLVFELVNAQTATYRISGLDGLTAADGVYELTVIGGGIRDYGLNAAAQTVSDRWAKGDAGPFVDHIEPIAPNPRNFALGSVDFIFSETLDLTTFTADDLTLTRGGDVVALPPNVEVTHVAGTEYRVSGLEGVTGSEGAYALRLNVADVQDASGAAGIGLATANWVMDTTAPQVLDVEDLATDPRNIVVLSLDVTLSEPIDLETFDFTDLRLTRNGGSNLIDTRVTVKHLSGSIYRIEGFNWVVGQEGTYELTVLGSGILDRAGNVATGSASETWLMRTTRPDAATDLRISPDTGLSSNDLLTNANALTISGTVAAPGLTVVVVDKSTNEQLGRPVSVMTPDGPRFSLNVNLAAGAHEIEVRTVDEAGNVSAERTTETILVDQTAPILTSLSEVTPDPRSTPVDAVEVEFSEAIRPSTFTFADLVLLRDGDAVALNSAVIESLTSTRYRISGLAPLTSAAGNYSLTAIADEIQDEAGNNGSGVLDEAWVTTASSLLIEHLQEVSPSLRTSPVDSLDVTFTEAINAATFDVSDLSFVRDSAPITIVNVTITAISPTTFRIGGLAALNGIDGEYSISVDASGIESVSGAAGAGVSTRTWTIDLQIPTVLDVVDVTPDPRDTAVGSVEIQFSEPVNPDSLDFNDLLLTRDGGSNLITNAVSVRPVAGDATRFVVSGLDGLTNLPGTYQLTVSGAEVQDMAGNSGEGSASDEWINNRVIIDNAAPVSAVLTLPAVSEVDFLVAWRGDDGPDGSGVSFFDIFVSIDGATAVLWLDNVTTTSATYHGEEGHSYAFYSVATDRNGNEEAAPAQADAATQILLPAGVIHGFKFRDQNSNREWDAGELALSGWTIYLDQNQNGQKDNGELFSVTDEDGAYRFERLRAGIYIVAEVMQEGWVQTFPGTVPSHDDGTQTAYSIRVLSGHSDHHEEESEEHAETPHRWRDFDPSTSDVIDIHYDYRGIGDYANVITAAQRGIVERALSDWEAASGGRLHFVRNTTAGAEDIITIGVGDLAALGYTSGRGNVLGLGGATQVHGGESHSLATGLVWLDFAETWDTTLGNGNLPGTYDFFTVVAQEIGHGLGLGHSDDIPTTDIMDGIYSGELTEFSLTDRIVTRNLYGSMPGDTLAFDHSELSSNVVGTHTVTLGPTDTVRVDFGNKSTEIHGTKWEDVDGDGSFDADEPTLAGWTIYIDTDNDGTLDDNEPRTTTDANGDYQFIGTPTGSVTVREVLQAGWGASARSPSTTERL